MDTANYMQIVCGCAEPKPKKRIDELKVTSSEFPFVTVQYVESTICEKCLFPIVERPQIPASRLQQTAAMLTRFREVS